MLEQSLVVSYLLDSSRICSTHLVFALSVLRIHPACLRVCSSTTPNSATKLRSQLGLIPPLLTRSHPSALDSGTKLRSHLPASDPAPQVCSRLGPQAPFSTRDPDFSASSSVYPSPLLLPSFPCLMSITSCFITSLAQCTVADVGDFLSLTPLSGVGLALKLKSMNSSSSR